MFIPGFEIIELINTRVILIKQTAGRQRTIKRITVKPKWKLIIIIKPERRIKISFSIIHY